MSYLSTLLGDAYKEGMTEEEISTALEAIGTEHKANEKANEGEITRLKNLISKANSEAANYKKQLREKQSDEEAARAAAKEEYDKLVEQNKELMKRISISDNSAELIKLGYDSDLAAKTAEAMYNGDMQTILASQAAFLAAKEKAIRAELMKSTPTPPAGSGSSTMTLAELRAMKMEDRVAFATEHPEEYAELYNSEH